MKPHFMGLLAATAIVGCDRTQPSPRTLVEQVYAAELGSTGQSTIVSKTANSYYSPSLLNLVKQDQDRAGDGYVGYLDYDPLCSCQETDGMSVKSIEITLQAANKATAKVTLHRSEPTADTITLNLILLPQGWRIEDISTHDTPSLRQELH
jgi:hypothetical protein